jgi:hypothetical protein
MEWTIIGVVRQYPGTVLAVGLLRFFALDYPWLENILHRLQRILRPLHYMIGALKRYSRKRFAKYQVECTIPRRAKEITGKKFEKEEKDLITQQSQVNREA